MTNRELKTQLKRLEQALPSLSIEEGNFIRQRLISRIKFYQFNQKPQNFYYLSFKEFVSFLFHPWRVARSFSVVTLGLILVVTLGIGTAVGANFAGPGDALYNLKISLERMPLVLPGPIMSEQAKAAREMELAHNRQNEIDSIIINTKDNKQAKSKKIKAAVVELSRNIEAAKARVEKISQTGEQKIVVQAANTLRENVADIKKSLDKVAKIIKDTEIDGNMSKDIDFAVQQASQAELSTLGVLIGAVSEDSAETADGDPEVSISLPTLVQTPEAVVGEEADVDRAKKAALEKEVQAQEQVGDQLEQPRQEAVAEAGTMEDKDVNSHKEEIGMLITKPDVPEVDYSVEPLLPDKLEQKAAQNTDQTIKDQIVKDLEQAILDLEADLTEQDTGVKQVEPAENLEAPEQKEQAGSKDQGANQNKEENVGNDSIGNDVVLNVEEVIAQEILDRQTEQKKLRLQELVDEARKSLEIGDLAASLEAVKQARELLGK
jgi:hypothetical protein